MSTSDFYYAYDFRTEIKLTGLELDPPCGETTVVHAEAECGGGDYILLYPYVTLQEVNGIPVGDQSRSLYYGKFCRRSGVPLKLQKGKNCFELKIRGPFYPESLQFALVRPLPEQPLPRRRIDREFHASEASVPPGSQIREDNSAWTPGAGHRTASPGRFGFAKGDGLLDCAVTCFGLIDKLYLCGHPEYRQPFRWGYCVLPGGEKAVSSLDEIKNDRIRINQLAVEWESQGVRIQYSLGSPGIMTECENQDMKLSQLEYAGGYQYIMTASRIVDPEGFRPEFMTENWLLLFGCAVFPEVPLLVVLDRRPERVEAERRSGRLSSLVFRGCRRMITATPFGMETLQPRTPDDADFLNEASRRCRLWSRAFLAFPVDCKEYFCNEHETGRCRIRQHFVYRMLEDEWHTEPLKLSPLPPAAVLSTVAEYSSDAADLKFPTKYGPLLAWSGEYSEYSLPMMLHQAEFPLRERTSRAAEVLKDGMEEYFAYQASYPENGCSYAYIGSHLERYGFAAMMFLFMDPEYRDRLAVLAGNSVKMTCDPETVYDCSLANSRYLDRLEHHTREAVRAVYDDPEACIRKVMKLYYSRREPFTGAEYTINYMNRSKLAGMKEVSAEEIRNYPYPYIENDWGLGISFYMIYICALASGCFEPVRRHWEDLCRMWDYLDIYHDWACMASGYSEDGITWCEGANYGIYHAFINLAEIAGDRARREYAIYMAAQELALRLAIYRSSQHYFHRFFGEAPYGITKAFREEHSPTHQFQGCPNDLDSRRLRPGQLHTFLTEGAFPELLRHCGRFLPEDHEWVTKNYLDQALDPRSVPEKAFWNRQMAPTMILLNMAENPAIPEALVREKLDQALQRDCIIRECRDRATYSTFQPVNLYHAMILSRLEARSHLLMLSHWEDVRILSASWESGLAVIRFECTGSRPMIRCLVKSVPVSVSVPHDEVRGAVLTLHPKSGGTAEIRFRN